MATIQRRGKRWRAIIRKVGYPTRIKSFRRKSDAQLWASEYELKMERLEALPSAAASRATLAELIDGFIAEDLPARRFNKDRATLENRLEVWKDLLGDRRAATLQPKEIRAALATIAKRKNRRRKGTLSGATLNRYRAALSVVYSQAMRNGDLASNPVARVDRRPESSGMYRILDPAEIKRVLAVAKSYQERRQSVGNINAYAVVSLALTTGLRRGNVQALRWEHVDLEQEQIAVPRGKHDAPRWLALIQPALSAIKDLPGDRTGYVFKGKDGGHVDATAIWKRLRADANLPGVRFHDLRHTAGSVLTMSGAGLAEVAHQLGHKTLEMARRYSHLTAEHSRRNAERMWRHMNGSENG